MPGAPHNVCRLLAPMTQLLPLCPCPGDYCYVIADTFGIDLEQLQAINPHINCELIQPSEWAATS